jgi:8-oxo-dGTP diphosphatase
MIKDFNVGVKGLVCVGNTCLVLKKGSGAEAYWDIPGGRIDGNESLAETLQRELSEELPSLSTYSVLEVVGAHRLSRDILEGKGLVLIFYKVEAEAFNVSLSDEHTDYCWVTKETLPSLLNSTCSIERGYYDAIARVLS